MKNLLLYCLLFGFTSFNMPLLAQDHGFSVNNSIISSIPAEVNVIGLGDPTHQESTITRYRINLIKRLVKERKVNCIAIEGNLFELYKAHQDFLKDKDVKHYEKAMYSQLNAAEMEDLYQFVYSENKQGNKVLIVGFDPSFSGETFTTRIQAELESLHVLSEEENNEFIKYLDKASVTNLKALFRNNRRVKSKITHYSNIILEKFEPKNNDERFFAQALRNITFLYSDENNHVDRRDRGMKLNVDFLQKLFPNEKIVLFGSSTHLLKNPKSIDTDFFRTTRGTTLGTELCTSSESQYFFIGYTALSGTKSNLFNKPKPLPAVVEGSIEDSFKNKSGRPSFYVTEETAALEGIMYSRFLGHSFVPLDLWEVMDGLVLVRDVEPFKIKE